jgi:hypothetical protein
MSTPPEDEVVVAYRNDDVYGQANFIGVITYLGDGTVYGRSSSSRRVVDGPSQHCPPPPPGHCHTIDVVDGQKSATLVAA